MFEFVIVGHFRISFPLIKACAINNTICTVALLLFKCKYYNVSVPSRKRRSVDQRIDVIMRQ